MEFYWKLGELDKLEINNNQFRIMKSIKFTIYFFAFLISFSLVKPAFAARLWSSGFELDSLTAGMEWTAIENTGATMSIQGTTKRSGDYALRCNPNGTNWGTVQFQSSALGGYTYYVRTYLNIHTSMSTEDAIAILGTSNYSSSVGLALNTDDTIDLYYYSGSVHVLGTSDLLEKDTWYMLEFSYNYSTGAVAARLNGSQFAGGSSVASQAWNYLFIGEGFGSGYTGDIYFDDVAFNDSTGSDQNSWPGEGSIVHVYPDSAGDNDDSAQSPNGYLEVDEQPTPDGDTSYANIDNNSDILDVDCESYSSAGIGSGDTVTLVQVGYRARGADATSRAGVLRIKGTPGGTISESSTLTRSSGSYQTNAPSPYGYKLTAYVNPEDSLAWEPNDISSMQIGFRATDAAPDIYLTSLWALVEYVPVGGGGGSDEETAEAMVFTVSAWVKPIGSIANKAIAVKDDEIRLVTDSSGHPLCQIHDGTSWRAAATSSQALALNEWAHVACAYDRSNLKIYVNGSETASREETSDVYNTANSWFFGHDESAAYGDFQGSIDEYKIYPYARTADQIRQDYAAGLAGIKSNSGVAASFGSRSDLWMSDGLVGYWKFDEPTTAETYEDSSGNGNTGTAAGNASTTAGKYGNGGVFDGDGDYVEISDLDAFKTISFWVKPEIRSGYDYYFVTDYDGSDFEISVDDHGYLVVGDFIYKNGTYLDIDDYIDTWNHIVVSLENNKYRFYFNGEFIQEGNFGSFTGSHPAYIGVWGTDYSSGDLHYFNGQIDEVRIYNRALSPDEVRKLYDWAPGPVAWWRFDELSGSTVYDSAASSTYSGGNHGSFGGGSANPTWTQGKYGGALRFDGSDDYVSLPDSMVLNSLDTSLTDVTVGAWVKLNSDPDARVGIISLGDVGNDYWAATVGTDVDNNKFSYYVDQTGSGTSSATALPVGEWHYVAFSRTVDGTVNFYYDGNPDGTETGTVSSAANGTKSIGIRLEAPVSFNGLIDDIKIYNYARTQKQILEDMTNGPALKSPILNFKFEEGYGDTVYDSSGNGKNATLHPGATGGNQSVSAMWDQGGKFGKAVEFDGLSDYISFPFDDIYGTSFERNNTVAAWFKTSSTSFQAIFGARESVEGSEDLYRLDTNEGRVEAVIRTERYTGDGDAVFVRTPVAYNDSEWHQAAMTMNDRILSLYVDGVKQGSTAVAGYSSEINVNYIGAEENDGGPGNGYGSFFEGLIDDVRIYNYALDEDEVKTLYNQGAAAVMSAPQPKDNDGTTVTGAAGKYCIPGDTAQCDAPVLEMDFNEMAGTTTHDRSGHGNDGYFVSQASSPVWKEANNCHSGSCLMFDGSDDYISYNSS